MTQPSMRLVLFAGSLVIGELAGFSLRPLSSCWLLVGFVVGVVLLALYAWGWRWVVPLAFLLGGFVLALRTEDVLRRILDGNSRLYGAREVLELPVEGEIHSVRRRGQGGWVVDFASHVGPVPLKVMLPIAKSGRLPRLGEVWRCEGWIGRKQDKAEQNRFSRRTLWVHTPRQARLLRACPSYSPVAVFSSLSRELARRVGVGLSWCPRLADLNRAILLGRRSSLSAAQRRLFAEAGTIHVFAISGLHVMVVAFLLRGFLARLEVPSPWQGLVVIPLLATYVVLTGARASAIRAALMASLWLLAPVMGRRSDSLVAWAVTVLIVYGLYPERVFDIGCTLSFVVMLGIVLWLEWARRFQVPFLAKGGWLTRQIGMAGVSLAAWIAGVPIAASVFGRLTPGGLIANLVVIKCAAALVKTGMGALIASFICIPLAALLNNVAAGFTWLMTYVSEWVARVPFASMEIIPWTLGECVAWYAFWILVFLLLGRYLPRVEMASQRWWN